MTGKKALESIIKNTIVDTDCGEFSFSEEIEAIKRDLNLLSILMYSLECTGHNEDREWFYYEMTADNKLEKQIEDWYEDD